MRVISFPCLKARARFRARRMVCAWYPSGGILIRRYGSRRRFSPLAAPNFRTNVSNSPSSGPPGSGKAVTVSLGRVSTTALARSATLTFNLLAISSTWSRNAVEQGTLKAGWSSRCSEFFLETMKRKNLWKRRNGDELSGKRPPKGISDMSRYYRYLHGLKLRKVTVPDRPRQPLWPPHLSSGSRVSG